MASEVAIGLYRTYGRAEDVRARLMNEGVPAADIELRRLAKDAVIPTPKTMVSFMDWLFGNDLPQQYGLHVTNGETAVCVRAKGDKELDLALAVLRLFAPLEVERLRPPEEAALWPELASPSGPATPTR
jgi:hypothetical protein